MSRIARYDVLYKSCYAHVISRSIRKLKLFKDEDDFVFLKNLLLRAKQRAEFKIYHYCLMQTHFHLTVGMGDLKDFSSAIRDVKRGYAYAFHSRYKLSGPLWRERFKSLLIENEDYLYACGKYIEGNPVKAGLVNQNSDWKHSSARHYELGEPDELIDPYDQKFRKIKGIELEKEGFESGSVIGSSFFRFQFFQSRKQSRPVTWE